jgi:hypothetical protein
MVQLTALAVQPSTFDPMRATLAGASLLGSQVQNATAALQLQAAQRHHGALADFGAQGGFGNPAALHALQSDPQLFTGALSGYSAHQTWQNVQTAQAAQRVLAAGPEGSEPRSLAYREELDRALRERRIDQSRYSQMIAQDPSDTALQRLIDLARPLTAEPSMTDVMRMPTGPLGGPPPSGGPRPLAPPVNLGMSALGADMRDRFDLNVTPESVGGPPLAEVQAALAQRPPQASPPGGPRVYGWMDAEAQTLPPGGVPLPGSSPIGQGGIGRDANALEAFARQPVAGAGVQGGPPGMGPTPSSFLSRLDPAMAQALPSAGAPPPAPAPVAAPAPQSGLPSVPGVTVGPSEPQSFDQSLAVNALSGGAQPPPSGRPENVGQVITRVLEGATAAQRARFWTLMSRASTRDDAMKLLQEVESGGVPLTARQRMESEEGLRREFATLAKPYFEMRDAFSRIEASVERVSPAGDMALIFNFMKMLDPGSVVREGEFATAQNAAGVPERILNTYNRLLSGERLNPTQRTDFVDQARRLLGAQQRQYQAIQGQIGTIARRGGLDPNNVLIDFTAPPTQADPQRLVTEARQAIASGRDPAAVRARLQEMGIDPALLDR